MLETDRANVFAVIDGILHTPSADGRILPGTTRAAVIARPGETIKAGQSRDHGPGAGRDRGLRHQRGVGVLPGPVHRRPPASLVPVQWPGTSPPFSPGAGAARKQPAGLVPDYPPAPVSPRPAPGGYGTACRAPVVADRQLRLVHLESRAHAGAGGAASRSCATTRSPPRRSPVPSRGVVISPGPARRPRRGSASRWSGPAPRGLPLLGICLGHQVIAAAFGGVIIRAPRPVHGQAFDVTHDGRGVLAGLPRPSGPLATTR